jgi:putative FmdB family regulatory protein
MGEGESQVALYEYVCEPNGHRFEVRHGMNEPPPPGCIECNGPIRRVIQPVGIMFKGSGFYATDSKASTAKKSDTKEASGDKNAESKPAAETKPDAGKSDAGKTDAGKADTRKSDAPAKD